MNLPRQTITLYVVLTTLRYNIVALQDSKQSLRDEQVQRTMSHDGRDGSSSSRQEVETLSSNPTSVYGLSCLSS